MNDREIDRLKKLSLETLELNKDTKKIVNHQMLMKLIHDVKRLNQQKNLVVMVIER
jgi:hypothetical protein